MADHVDKLRLTLTRCARASGLVPHRLRPTLTMAGQNCHAGGRGFESRRARLSSSASGTSKAEPAPALRISQSRLLRRQRRGTCATPSRRPGYGTPSCLRAGPRVLAAGRVSLRLRSARHRQRRDQRRSSPGSALRSAPPYSPATWRSAGEVRHRPCSEGPVQAAASDRYCASETRRSKGRHARTIMRDTRLVRPSRRPTYRSIPSTRRRRLVPITTRMRVSPSSIQDRFYDSGPPTARGAEGRPTTGIDVTNTIDLTRRGGFALRRRRL